MKLFQQCIMLVDNVNSWADNSWPTEQTAVWEKHLNIRRPKDTLLAQAEPALRFSTCSSLVAGPSLLREVRPSCSIYGGTHLASDRVFGWLANMFPLGFKSHVEPNVTVDFFLFFLYKLTSDGMRRNCQVNSKGTGYQITPSTVVPFNRESLV